MILYPNIILRIPLRITYASLAHSFDFIPKHHLTHSLTHSLHILRIRDKWADHFEALGTPSENEYFDNAFLSRVVSGVREIFDSCTNNPFGVLCEPLDYDEVACVCSELKLGVTGLCIDYEHLRFADPPLRACLKCIRISTQMALSVNLETQGPFCLYLKVKELKLTTRTTTGV